jgi:hypothetical protein
VEEPGATGVMRLRNKKTPEADLLIPQIDLTHTPSNYVEYIRSYGNVANRDLDDISKRKISTHLLRTTMIILVPSL